MKQLRSLDEVTKALLTYSPPQLKGNYTLERMRCLMDYLDNPQDELRIVHIAGTSGKTSTAYFIRGMLEAAGQKTGLTVSPHIVAINERVQISGRPLEQAAFLQYINQFLPLVAQSGLKPTYFELLIALAYWIFAREKVDYAIIETGLGGLLDATNITSRFDKLCVISDIGLDHTEILGTTLAAIARQKAGIIAVNNHLILQRQNSQVAEVITTIAIRQHASVQMVADYAAAPDLAEFQKRNWALAQAAYNYLENRDNLPKLTQSQIIGVSRQTPPGRWEIHHYGDKTIILDGAHNPQKLMALHDALVAAHIPPTAVMANLTNAPDSKLATSLDVLRSFATHLIIPEFSAGQDLKSRRSFSANHFSKIAKQQGVKSIDIHPKIADAFQALLSRPEKTLIITGSLYLVSLVRPFVRQLCQ